MYEAFKITACILGVASLYIGLVALIENKGDVFFYVLPFNVLFICKIKCSEHVLNKSRIDI